MKISEIINLENYPINDTGSIKYNELINYTRKQLNEDGCCVLSNFIRPDSIKRMKDEVDRNLEKIYFTSDQHNPYFTKEDKTLNENHPKRIFTVRQKYFLFTRGQILWEKILTVLCILITIFLGILMVMILL